MLNQDVPAYHVAAGNPARVLRKIERKFKAEQEAKTAGGRGGVEA